MNKETEKIMAEVGAADPEGSELEELRRDKSLRANLEAELKLLKEIFPDIKAEDIPDEVIEDCDNGKGLAAQYALWFLTNQKKKEETQKTNEKNTKSAPPEVNGVGDETFFTPEMVRTMSDKDVRRHYKAIMRSMEKWTN